MKHIVQLAALFHDAGKANDAFQSKLSGNDVGERFRHEWISLLMFSAITSNKTDKQWLSELANGQMSADIDCSKNPFTNMPPLAKFIGWLIVTHHRLLEHPDRTKDTSAAPALKYSGKWMDESVYSAWNDPFKGQNYGEMPMDFSNGTLADSDAWKFHVSAVAELIMRNGHEPDLLKDKYWCYRARLILQLADHVYSSEDANAVGDKEFDLYANTDKNGNLKQKLDEHCICVADKCGQVYDEMEQIDAPAVTDTSAFTERTGINFFKWQNDAMDTANAIDADKGFFGISMASTGRGKTIANAKVMYAISGRARFNIAIGLRSITLQTSDAIRERLNVQPHELATVIGSEEAIKLHELDNAKQIKADYDVMFTGDTASKWLGHRERLKKLVAAPLVVSTIDHLIGASEGVKGGRQIGPALRLANSDLIIDEVDDFGNEDLPAVCRLVHTAALCGARVLVSTATITPALAAALYRFYKDGREAYAKATGLNSDVECAWFDEYESISNVADNDEQYKKIHNGYVEKRAKRLKETPPLRKASVLDIVSEQDVAATVKKECLRLHSKHNEKRGDKRVSVGLVRMTYIRDIIDVAKQLVKLGASENTRIHYCIYHSQFPLAVRSHIERELDELLSRAKVSIFDKKLVSDALEAHSEDEHLFVVIASPVSEVGRDHDYDWSVIEPASMRSIIQTSGRIQRHRKQVPTTSNISIMSKNVRQLRGHQPAFTYQTKDSVEESMRELVNTEEIEAISSISRIVMPSLDRLRNGDLVGMEHGSIIKAINPKSVAANWLNDGIHCFSDLQALTEFRKSDEQTVITVNSPVKFEVDGEPVSYVRNENVELSDGVTLMLNLNVEEIYQELESKIGELTEPFKQVAVRKVNASGLRFSEAFGLYK